MTRAGRTLQDWLDYAAGQHPRQIEMGLDRMQPIVKALTGNDRRRLARQIVTVGGTNGKGSTCASLEALSRVVGLNCGCYTSPHLLRFNERIRINGEEVSDERLTLAFERIEDLRRDTPLTWFELTTLVAFEVFLDAGLDILILEVGLGGRLDAVNTVDPDLAIITSVGLDHVEWLGNDRESIAREKAGILRAGIPLILGESDVPRSILDRALALGCEILIYQREFEWTRQGDQWRLRPDGIEFSRLPPWPRENLACALMAMRRLGHSLDCSQASDVVQKLDLRGRLQVLQTSPLVMADVCHNPHGASWLAATLAQPEWRHQYAPVDQWVAVFSGLDDKDLDGVVEALASSFKHWHTWRLAVSRAASAEKLLSALKGCSATLHEDFARAMEAAAEQARNAKVSTGILVFGSFHVVEVALQYWSSQPERKRS